MSDEQKRIANLKSELDSSWERLDLDHKNHEITELSSKVSDPDFWRDPESARQTHARLSALTDLVSPWNLLRTQVSDITELLSLGDDTLSAEISAQITALEDNYSELKKQLRFTGQYDSGGAILRITAGVGGVEAMDFAGMLERMYLRFLGSNHFAVSTIERTSGEEAGIKTVVYEVSGANAYGNLKSEHGVHRLVRLSPFNADNLRQTSFALVEILPVIPADTDLKIDSKDLRIDVYRSGGHGGQSVNTTDSAVRITHLPTGTVVAIQNERSQLQNREKALEILRGKLVQMQQEQQAASIGELRAGESASWGQQIRNYILQPYRLVKDTRTKHETTDVTAVLDGDLSGFIEAYLDSLPTDK